MEKKEPTIQELLDNVKKKTIEQNELLDSVFSELKRCRGYLCFICGNRNDKEKIYICSDCRYRDGGPWTHEAEDGDKE